VARKNSNPPVPDKPRAFVLVRGFVFIFFIVTLSSYTLFRVSSLAQNEERSLMKNQKIFSSPPALQLAGFSLP
jgi:hypothetical protein